MLHEAVVCPFCSLACDDLEVEAQGDGLRLRRHGCDVAAEGFGRPLGDPTPLVDGTPASLEAAVERAAAILRGCRLPLIGGLGTDTGGARAAIALAEVAGGVLDHAGGAGLFGNIRALQDGGWVTATLAEARNRADLVLMIGAPPAGMGSRLWERLLGPGPRIAEGCPRRVVFLGGELPERLPVEARRIAVGDLALAVAGLRARVEGRGLTAEAVGGVPLAELDALAGALREARYALVVWTAAALPGQADLLVGMIAGLLRSLNETTRAAGLPLAGPDNVIGVNQVCAWQTGVPLRTSLASGAPDHDPWRYGTERLVADGLVDGVLWVSSWHEPKPPGGLPTILLARSGCAPPGPVDVMIPVGAPGLDHAGSLYRTDSVVSLPLRRLRDAGLPTVAGVLDRIRVALC